MGPSHSSIMVLDAQKCGNLSAPGGMGDARDILTFEKGLKCKVKVSNLSLTLVGNYSCEGHK